MTALYSHSIGGRGSEEEVVRRKEKCESQQCKGGLSVFLFSSCQVEDKHDYGPSFSPLFFFFFVNNLRSKAKEGHFYFKAGSISCCEEDLQFYLKI